MEGALGGQQFSVALWLCAHRAACFHTLAASFGTRLAMIVIVDSTLLRAPDSHRFRALFLPNRSQRVTLVYQAARGDASAYRNALVRGMYLMGAIRCEATIVVSF